MHLHCIIISYIYIADFIALLAFVISNYFTCKYFNLRLSTIVCLHSCTCITSCNIIVTTITIDVTVEILSDSD